MARLASHNEQREIGVVARHNPGMAPLQQATRVEAHVGLECRGQGEPEGMHHAAEHWAQILVPGVQTHFNRVSDEGDLRLTKVQLFAGGHTLLEFDETDRPAPYPGNAFGDAMLDLDTRIDFEKVRIALLINQKLDCRGTAQAHRAAQAERVGTDALQRLLASAQTGNARCSYVRIELGDFVGDRLGMQGDFNKLLIAVVLQ